MGYATHTERMKMFSTRKKLDALRDSTNYEIKELKEKYWKLWHKHELLLKHLGLTEHKIPESIELRTKGGPGVMNEKSKQ